MLARGGCLLIDVIVLDNALLLLYISVCLGACQVFSLAVGLVHCLKLLGKLILIFGRLCVLTIGLVDED